MNLCILKQNEKSWPKMPNVQTNGGLSVVSLQWKLYWQQLLEDLY